MNLARGRKSVTPFETLPSVEVVGGVQVDIEFEVVRNGLETNGVRGGAMTGVVGPGTCAIGVLEKENLLLLLGSQVDIVLGGDGVVVFFFLLDSSRYRSVSWDCMRTAVCNVTYATW